MFTQELGGEGGELPLLVGGLPRDVVLVGNRRCLAGVEECAEDAGPGASFLDSRTSAGPCVLEYRLADGVVERRKCLLALVSHC